MIAATSYRESMAELALKTDLDIWYERVDPSSVVAALAALPAVQPINPRNRAQEAQEGGRACPGRGSEKSGKARARDAWSAIEKITEVVDGQRRFRNQPPLLARLDANAETYALVNHLFHTYRRRWRRIGRYFSDATRSSTLATRSSGSAASDSCVRAAHARARRQRRWSCRSNRLSPRSSSPTPASRCTPKHRHRVVAGQATHAGPPATHSSAGSRDRAGDTSMSVSSGTRSGRQILRAERRQDRSVRHALRTHWPGLMPAGTPWRFPPTWAAAHHSTKPSPNSPSPTRTRQSVISRNSRPLSPTDGSKHTRNSELQVRRTAGTDLLRSPHEPCANATCVAVLMRDDSDAGFWCGVRMAPEGQRILSRAVTTTAMSATSRPKKIQIVAIVWFRDECAPTLVAVVGLRFHPHPGRRALRNGTHNLKSVQRHSPRLPAL